METGLLKIVTLGMTKSVSCFDFFEVSGDWRVILKSYSFSSYYMWHDCIITYTDVRKNLLTENHGKRLLGVVRHITASQISYFFFFFKDNFNVCSYWFWVWMLSPGSEKKALTARETKAGLLCVCKFSLGPCHSQNREGGEGPKGEAGTWRYPHFYFQHALPMGPQA